MQNEELQHVFNLSEHQNHRYNGYYGSSIPDRTPVKTKRGSPKKKNTADMVTVTAIKPVVKRRSKLKTSASKAEDVINGVATAGNVFLEHKDPSVDKYRVPSLNHLNNIEADGGSFDTINSIFSGLTNNVDPTPSNSRASLLNHVRTHAEAPSISVTYSKNQFLHSNDFVDSRGNVSKSIAQRLNNVTANSSNRGKHAKLDESKTKSDQLPSYLLSSPQFQYKLPSTNSSMLFDSFADRAVDCRFAESGFKDAGKKQNPVELAINNSCESKLFLRAKRRRHNRKKWQMDSGTRHEALQRIRDCLELQDNLHSDLFPLHSGETGYDKSDSESSSEECLNTFQNHWFHSTSEIEFDEFKRNMRLSQLYSELRRQLYQIKQNKCQLPVLSDKFMKPLIEVARTRPLDAVHCLNQHEQQRFDTVEPLILTKKKCALEACKNVALPCMPTCVRHVLLCDKQMLFEQCRVRESDNFQCEKPVLNIKYHYPVCAEHSKPDFVLPDFSRQEIKYEDIRRKNVSTASATTYKTDVDLINMGVGHVSCLSTSSKVETKKRASSSNNNNNSSNNSNAFAPGKQQQFNARSLASNEKREREKKPVERKESKARLTKNNEETKTKNIMPVIPTTQTAAVTTLIPPQLRKPDTTSTVVDTLKEEPTSSSSPLVPEVNQNLLPEWVSLSDSQLVDTKTLESTLQNDFVNGFDINASSIQSQIQDIINSESSLSTNMLMGAQELPNYIQVEEMIEEVEITDETLDPSELGNQELVHSEDFNAVLKQLPPEAFNELFSEFTLSEG